MLYDPERAELLDLGEIQLPGRRSVAFPPPFPVRDDAVLVRLADLKTRGKDAYIDAGGALYHASILEVEQRSVTLMVVRWVERGD
jgi:hypothetical protein